MSRLETRVRRLEAAQGDNGSILLVLVPYGVGGAEQERLAEAEAEHGRGHALTVLVTHFGDWPALDGRQSWAQPMVR